MSSAGCCCAPLHYSNKVWSRPLGVAALWKPACWTSTPLSSDCGVSERDCRARFFIRFARASRWAALQGWAWCRRSAGRFCAPLYYSSAQDHSSFGLARCAQVSLGCPAWWTTTISDSDCGVRERDYRARFFIRLARASRWAALRKCLFGVRCRRSAG